MLPPRPLVSRPSLPPGSLGVGLLPALAFVLGILLGPAPAAPAADAPPEIAIDRDGPTVRLTLPGEGGKEYSIEAIEALLNRGGVWTPVATVAPSGSPVSLYDPTCTTRPQNFYRLRLLSRETPVEVPNFRLIDDAGRARELFYQSDARAVVLVFAGANPAATLASDAPTLRDLESMPADHGVRTWIVTVGSPADRAARTAGTAALGLNLPVLEDEAGAVSRRVGSGIVPEAVVLNPADWSVLYRGRIADTVATAAGERRQSLVLDSLERHRAGQPVVIRHTASVGQPLDGSAPRLLSYASEVAPLLQKHCVPCHSPGNIAPWAMTNHAIIGDYAALIRDEILTRRMPPWHADRAPQSYSNDGMLPAADLSRILDWIDQGAQRGEGPDPLAASVPPPPPQWPLGTPSRIVSINTQSIPASGTVGYRHLVALSPFTQDTWIRAAVVKPGNAQVVHHVLVFSASSPEDILQVQGGLGGYFAAYVPGMAQVPFPEGTGKLLKKGSFLVFQMHYTATGKPETDRTQLGLYVSSTPPGRELRTAAAYNTQFTIPAGAADHVAAGEFTLPRDGVVYELSPHMHYRGSWMRFDAILPDNRRETLLNVPYYRFDWQTLYRLAEPRRLPAGTRIVVSGAWDNSNKNPYNPDPGANVRFGEQSWEEMLIGYFNWSDAP